MVEQTQREFAQGLFVKTIETKYGELIKLSINKDSILNNPFNEQGWVNIVLKRSKAGNMYPEIDNFVPNKNYASNNDSNSATTSVKNSSNDNLVEFGDMEPPAVESLMDEEEIPF
jgi:hypothetical protein